MTAILVDSNVLLDVITEDPRWADWSAAQLEQLADEHVLVINPLVYAEVSLAFATIEALEQCLPSTSFRREPLPWEAGFLAGRAFLGYRRRGGERRSPMPDFYIGAHAAIAGHRLLTRDVTRYRGYFPTVQLIAPDG